MKKTRVFLSDPQVLFREGIHFVLSGEEDFEVIGETTSNEEAIAYIEANPPHIAILSLHDTQLDGMKATRRIRRNLPSVAVVLTMDKTEARQILAAIRSGASACLAREADPDQLLEIIRTIARGGSPAAEELLQPGLASIVLSEFNGVAALNKQLDNLLASLSPRETQELTDIAAGEDIGQVARCLDTDEESVRNSLKVVLAKLMANDQARSVLEIARNLPAKGKNRAAKADRRADYVTRAEFKDFQETLMAGLRSVIGDQPLKS
jgi:two-component system NarL family response regulator